MFNIKINCSILRKYQNKKLKQATSLIRVEKNVRSGSSYTTIIY